MLKLSLTMFLLNYWASIPTMGPHLLPGSEPNQWGLEEIEITEEEGEWIWLD